MAARRKGPGKTPGIFSPAKFREQRTRLDVSQDVLAKLMSAEAVEHGWLESGEAMRKFSGASIQRWEAGIHEPQFNAMVCACWVFGCTMEDLGEKP